MLRNCLYVLNNNNDDNKKLLSLLLETVDVIIITTSCLFTLWPKRKGIYTTVFQPCLHRGVMSEIYWKCTREGNAWLCWSRTFSHQCVEKATPSTDGWGHSEQVYLRKSLSQKTENGGKLENFIAESGSSVQHCMSLPNVWKASLKGKWEIAVWADPSHLLLASQIPKSVSLCSPLSSLISWSNLLYLRHLLGAL